MCFLRLAVIAALFAAVCPQLASAKDSEGSIGFGRGYALTNATMGNTSEFDFEIRAVWSSGLIAGFLESNFSSQTESLVTASGPQDVEYSGRLYALEAGYRFAPMGTSGAYLLGEAGWITLTAESAAVTPDFVMQSESKFILGAAVGYDFRLATWLSFAPEARFYSTPPGDAFTTIGQISAMVRFWF